MVVSDRNQNLRLDNYIHFKITTSWYVNDLPLIHVCFIHEWFMKCFFLIKFFFFRFNFALFIRSSDLFWYQEVRNQIKYDLRWMSGQIIKHHIYYHIKMVCFALNYYFVKTNFIYMYVYFKFQILFYIFIRRSSKYIFSLKMATIIQPSYVNKRNPLQKVYFKNKW